jgi:hypothetical protein
MSHVLNFSILITYPVYGNFIQVGYQSENPKHVFDRKQKKQKKNIENYKDPITYPT